MPTRLPSASPASPAPVSFFTQERVLRMLGITRRQMDRWERLRLIEPAELHDREKLYSFAHLVTLRTIKQLTKEGVPAVRLQHALEAVRWRERPANPSLAELRIVPSGRNVTVEYGGVRVDPLSGQMLLRFEFGAETSRLRAMPERSPEEWFEVALACEGNKDLALKAVDAYNHVLEAAPDWLEAHINLGTLLCEQGDLENALKHYQCALQLDPDNALVHFNLGTILDELKNLQDACTHLRTAVRLRPEFADAHYNLARVYDELGELQRARNHWRRYLELDSSSSWAKFARRRLEEGRSLHSFS